MAECGSGRLKAALNPRCEKVRSDQYQDESTQSRDIVEDVFFLRAPGGQDINKCRLSGSLMRAKEILENVVVESPQARN